MSVDLSARHSLFRQKRGKPIPGPGTRERTVFDHDDHDDFEDHGDDWGCHWEDSHDDHDSHEDHDDHDDHDDESGCDY